MRGIQSEAEKSQLNQGWEGKNKKKKNRAGKRIDAAFGQGTDRDG